MTFARVRSSEHSLFSIGALAGLMGGVAEVLWVSFYQELSGAGSAVVARGVTQSVLPDLAGSPLSVPLGIAIHMSLAVALGIAVALLARRVLPRLAGTAFEPLVVVSALAAVWAVNFLLILPVINPGFVTLMPMAATLTSKVLFGFAAALVLAFFNRGRQAG